MRPSTNFRSSVLGFVFRDALPHVSSKSVKTWELGEHLVELSRTKTVRGASIEGKTLQLVLAVPRTRGHTALGAERMLASEDFPKSVVQREAGKKWQGKDLKIYAQVNQ